MAFTVFLGNLPTWVTADDIKQWLAAEDLVADAVKVIRNHETQESKGFAFVEAPTARRNAIDYPPFRPRPFGRPSLARQPGPAAEGQGRARNPSLGSPRCADSGPWRPARAQKTRRQAPRADPPQRVRGRIGQGSLIFRRFRPDRTPAAGQVCSIVARVQVRRAHTPVNRNHISS